MSALRRVGGVLIAALVGLSASLGGCSNVPKSKYDAAVQEAAELRERNAQLESSNRDKDLKIADLESRSTQQPQVIYTGAPSAPAAAGTNFNGDASADQDFRRDARTGNMVAEIAGNVLFDSGSATLKSTGRKSLDRIASTLNSKFSRNHIRVEGHTDSDPIKHSKWASNDALSQARADSVKKYLQQKGVSAGRLDSVGMGSSQPKGSKATSRRVEIVVLAN